jgi:hypothetical protein
MKHIRWHFFPTFFFFFNIIFFSQPGNNKYLLFKQTLEKLGQTHVSNGYIYGQNPVLLPVLRSFGCDLAVFTI